MEAINIKSRIQGATGGRGDGFGKVNTQVLIALFFVPFVYVKYCVFEGLWTL